MLKAGLALNVAIEAPNGRHLTRSLIILYQISRVFVKIYGEKLKSTASAGGIIINDKNEVALTCHEGGRHWNFPKGRVEPGENLEETAQREVYEETGIKDAKLVKFLGKYQRFRLGADGISENKSELKIIYLYLFKSNQTKMKPIDPDNPCAEWFAKDKILDILKHPKDKKFFRSIVDNI